MKILLLCVQPYSLISNGMINSLSTIYAYFFNKWLSRIPGCQVDFASCWIQANGIEKLETYDFCIHLVNRGVGTMRPAAYLELRKKVKHQIITLCASSKFTDKEDLLLFIMGKKKPKTKRLFWGADFDLLKPLKPETITILVDHKYYGKKGSIIAQMDMTEKILQSLLAYKANNNIVIKHIGKGRVNEINDGYTVDNFTQGSAMDFRKIYEYYNEAHIYVVTHPECFGLSTVECGSAGALVVQPSGYIKKEIISNLHHYNITDMANINWDDIISKINITKSIECAKTFSYEKNINHLYGYMNKIYTKAS